MPDAQASLPLFRSDLIVTQSTHEDQPTYIIRDEVTGESFRLYAVEYAIAQRLNGARTLDEVLEVVHAELAATITLPELIDFLRQLAERGFVQHFVDPQEVPKTEPTTLATEDTLDQTATLHGEVVLPSVHEMQTRETQPDPIAPTDAAAPLPIEDSATQISPGDAVAAGAYALVTQELDMHAAAQPVGHKVEVDPKELDHLLRDAIKRMVDDDVRGAATILHAAQALAPQDERLSQLVEATQVARVSGTPAAHDALRERGATLYPELMPERATPPPVPRRGAKAIAGARRGLWLTAAGVLILLGGVTVWHHVRPDHAVEVTIQQAPFAAHRQLAGPAVRVSPHVQATLSFTEPGVVAQVLPPGTRIQAQQIVASQRLAPPLRLKITQAQTQTKKAEATLMRLQTRREQLRNERRALMDKIALARKTPGPAAVGARLAARQRLVERQERQVRAALVGAQTRKAQALQAVKASEEAAGAHMLRAPTAGVIGEVAVSAGQTVARQGPVLTVVDPNRLEAHFEVPGTSMLQVGAPVDVLWGERSQRTLAGTVLAVQPTGQKSTSIVVGLPGQGGGKGVYTLVVQASDMALQVPKTAVVQDARGVQSYIWSFSEGQLRRYGVRVLDSQDEMAWVLPDAAAHHLGPFALVVAARGQKLDALREGVAASAVQHASQGSKR